jgi:para-nitrobenzyl esterase
MPGMSTNEKIEMARSMTLKQVQQYAPDQFKDETLAKIDADLAKIPAPKK